MKKMLFKPPLLLYPLRVILVEMQRVTRVLFARSAATAAGSPGITVVQEIADNTAAALRAGVAAAEGR